MIGAEPSPSSCVSSGPVLVLMLFFGGDYGRAVWSKLQVDDAALAGAMYASLHGYNSSAVATAAQATTNLTVSVSSNQWYGCAAATGVTSVTQNFTCTGGGGNHTAGTYLTVTASYNFQPLAPGSLLGSPFTMTSSVTTRIQ